MKRKSGTACTADNFEFKREPDAGHGQRRLLFPVSGICMNA